MQGESKNVPPDEGVKRSVCSRRLPLIACCQPARGGASWINRFFRCQSTTRRNNMQQMISNVRTMFLVRGIAAIVFGILTLVWPNLTLSVLVLLFGVYAVIGGITAVAAGLRSAGGGGRGVGAVGGTAGVPAGGGGLGWS